MLTNHVPELRLIVRKLGLAGRFARIFNSAQTGYENPIPIWQNRTSFGSIPGHNMR